MAYKEVEYEQNKLDDDDLRKIGNIIWWGGKEGLKKNVLFQNCYKSSGLYKIVFS